MPSAAKSPRIFVTWQLAGVFLATVALVTLGIRYLPFKTDFAVAKAMPLLVSAYSKSRPVELRLSGGFRPGPFVPDGKERGLVNLADLEHARRLILEQATRGNDVESRLGYARLAVCERSSDKAKEHLDELLVRFPENAEVQNETGVYLFEHGDLAGAVEKFENAIKLADDMPEPLFNRAVCYQKMYLLAAAMRDFYRLKEIERDPGWLSEIDTRMEEVASLLQPRKPDEDPVLILEKAAAAGDFDGRNQILDRSFESIWVYALKELPKQYLEARLNSDSDRASALLSRMNILGPLFLERKNDSFLKELYAYLQSVPENEVENEKNLARDYWEATRRARALDPFSLPALDRISNECRRRGNLNLMILAEFSRSIPLSVRNQYHEVIELLQPMVVTLDQHEWPLLRSSILVQLGNAYLDVGKLSLVISLCDEAMETFKERPTMQGKALQSIGTAYWKLGNFGRALNYLRRSTDTFMAGAFDADTMYSLYVDIGYNYLTIADIYFGYKNHSLAYQNADQALRFFELGDGRHYVTEALALKATEEANLGMFDASEESLARAVNVLPTLDEKSRRNSEKLVLIRAGEIALQRNDLKRALDYFSSAADKAAKEKGDVTLRIRALRGLSEASARMGESRKARASLDTAGALIEGYRAGIRESGNRTSYLDAVQSVFDQRVSLEIQDFGNAATAFDFAEVSRARSLLDDIFAKERKQPASAVRKTSTHLTNPPPSRPTVQPLKLREIQSRMPPGLVLLMYTVTPEDTFAFVVDRKNLNWKSLRLKSADIERDVKDYLAEIDNKSDLNEVNRRALKLYRDLVGPVREWIPDKTNLCIVPDKSLNLVPMAALVDENGRYLMESFTLTNAPSASVLLESLKKADEMPATDAERLLIVANATFSREKFPQLQDIYDTEGEANKIKELYSLDSIMLSKSNATEQRVQTAIRDCDVAHFALHVLVEERSPWLAAIVLAATSGEPPRGGPNSEETGDNSGSASHIRAIPRETSSDSEDGLLYLSEIYNFGLTHTRLVVLSGCQSGLGQYYKGEGMVSLVRPFLASNVPTVLASLWAVNSRVTSTLMIDFHSERKKGHLGAGDALRNAQISMAHGPEPYNHPYYWAPFIVVGGNN
jgi:CHAT domain-containing protein